MNRTRNALAGSLFLALCPLLTAPLGAQIVSGVYERYYTLDGTGEGDTFGGSVAVAGAGDMDRDGFADVIVGTPLADPRGLEDAGSAYVYSGKDGSLLWQFHGTSVGHRMGSSVAGAGDVNRDGFPDVIVGAPRGGWVYTGLSEPMPLYDIGDGRLRHSRSLAHAYGTHSVRHFKAKGVFVEVMPQSPKHRYIYFLDPTWRIKLRATELPYPKREVLDASG